MNPKIVQYFDQDNAGNLVRDTSKYKESLYVKYLTPVEQIVEFSNFIDKIKKVKNIQIRKDAFNSTDSLIGDSSDFKKL
jgi:hypothetical protein